MSPLQLLGPQTRWWSGAFLATMLLTGSSVFASPTPAHTGAEALPHGTTVARPPTQLRRDFEQGRAAQARYDIPKLLSLARDCRNLALTLRKLQAERVCDDAMFGAAQRLGDARSMVEADYWWQQHGFSAADKTSKANSAPQAANLARLIDTVPAFSAKVVGSSSVLKYQHRIEFAGRVAAEPLAWHRPMVTVTVNGKSVMALVDTGTVLPLMMDQAHAKALGAIPLMVGDWVKPGRAKNPPTGKSSTTALITRFKFGDLVMHNVAATIVPDGRFGVGVLVGLPVLARFGRVNLSDTQITTGAAVGQCASGTPLTFVGEGQLGFLTTANGRPTVAMVDTGSMYALLARPGTNSAYSTEDKTSPSKRPERLSGPHRRVRVQIGAWSMMGIDMPDTKPTPPQGVDVSIGAPLLAFADVQFDFSNPSLCVSPKPAVKDGAVIVFRNQREESLAKGPVAALLRALEAIMVKMSSPAGVHQGHAAAHAQ